MLKFHVCLGWLLLACVRADRVWQSEAAAPAVGEQLAMARGGPLDVLKSSLSGLLLTAQGLEELAGMLGRGEKIEQLPRPLSEEALLANADTEHVTFGEVTTPTDTTSSAKEPTLAEDMKKPPEPFVDKEQPFKDWGTKFVVKSLLGPGSENNFEFFQLVVNTVQKTLQAYKREAKLGDEQIVFLFKGGNVLRLLLQTFMNWFHNSIQADQTTEVRNAKRYAEAFHDIYAPYFVMSDADFGIFIDTSLQAENFTRVQQDVCLLAYLAQVKIRQELQSNIGKYFPILTEWESKGDSELQEWLREGMQPTVDKFTIDGDYKDFAGAQLRSASRASQHDTMIFKDAAHQDRFGDLMLKPSSEMPISWNDALDFVQGGRLSTFTLVRTKFRINVDYVISGENGTVGAPGELIDISVPKQGDVPAAHLWHFLRDEVNILKKRWDSNRAVATYKITQIVRGQQSSLTFHSEALFELKEELTNMLFASTHNKPWEMKKYEKRLARVMFLSFVDLFQQYEDMSMRLSALAITKGLVQGWKESTELNTFTTSFLPCMSFLFGDNAPWRKTDKHPNQTTSFFLDQKLCVGSAENPDGLFWYHANAHAEYFQFMQSPQSQETILYNVIVEHAVAVLQGLVVNGAHVESGEALVHVVEERQTNLGHAEHFVDTILRHLSLQYEVLLQLRDYHAFSTSINSEVYDAITMY